MVTACSLNLEKKIDRARIVRKQYVKKLLEGWVFGCI